MTKDVVEWCLSSCGTAPTVLTSLQIRGQMKTWLKQQRLMIFWMFGSEVWDCQASFQSEQWWPRYRFKAKNTFLAMLQMARWQVNLQASLQLQQRALKSEAALLWFHLSWSQLFYHRHLSKQSADSRHGSQSHVSLAVVSWEVPPALGRCFDELLSCISRPSRFGEWAEIDSSCND